MILTRLLPLVAAALVVLPRGGDAHFRQDERGGAPPAAQEAPALPEELRIRVDVATRRAVKWLLERQGLDGSWRSPQYGVLRGGQAYTPFVLHALLSVPERVREVPKEAIDNALAFIRSQLTDDGALGYHDPDVLEYPVYATSYAIRALKIAAPDDPLVPKMAAWLAGMQLVEKKGFEPKSPAYGGWSFGVRTLPPGDPGHMDLAHTRRALEALREAGALTAPIRTAALRFLGLVQKLSSELERFPGVPGFEDKKGSVPFDGGFFFSPIVLAANKALWEKPDGHVAAYFRSYSTATADGVLALLALWEERPPERGPDFLRNPELRIRRARVWLMEHWGADPTGIPADHPEPWVAALRCYGLAVMAEVASAPEWKSFPMPWPKGHLDLLAKRLVEIQASDGSYVNVDSALMKEDDPILATTLALVALGRMVPKELSEPKPPAESRRRPDSRREPEVFRQDVAWSPDGKQLAFSEHVRDGVGRPGQWTAWVVGTDGGARRKLSDDACWVTWKPDGTELAFSVEMDGESHIWVARPDGSDVVRITEHKPDPGPDRRPKFRDLHPAWSPNGEMIAFSSNREGNADIWVMASNGSIVTRLTRDAAQETNPSWSPDGKRIVFHRETAESRSQIRSVGVDGKGEVTVVADAANNYFPSFLRGGRIGFASQDKLGKHSLATVESDGTGRARLDAPESWFARWSPDGSRVAFISGSWPRSRIFLMNADGSGVRKLEN